MRYDVYHRMVSAKNAKALRLQATIRLAGVSICSYRKDSSEMAKGDTFATRALLRVMDDYGAEILILTLRCITESGNGNPGEIRADIVQAIALVLRMFPAWAGHPGLIRAFDTVSFVEVRRAARLIRRGTGAHQIIAALIVRAISIQLEGSATCPNLQS